MQRQEDVISSFFNVVFHELYHSYQFKIKFTPILYIICAFPILREITIEPFPYKLSNEIRKYLNEKYSIKFENNQRGLLEYVYGDGSIRLKSRDIESGEEALGRYTCSWKFTDKYSNDELFEKYIKYIKLGKINKIKITNKFNGIILPIIPKFNDEQYKILNDILYRRINIFMKEILFKGL